MAKQIVSLTLEEADLLRGLLAATVLATDVPEQAQPTKQGPAYDAVWDNTLTRGPADLYHHLAIAALSEHMPILNDLSEQTHELVLEAVNLAVSVVCKAASVPNSWGDIYQASTEHLRK